MKQRIFMKRCSALLLCIALLFSVAAPKSASAAIVSDTSDSVVTRIDLGNGYYMEESIETPDSSGIAVCALSTSGNKKYKFYNNADTHVATFTLKGTFSYGTGAPAECTSASYSTWTKNSKYKFTASTAYKDGNKARGGFTLVYKTSLVTQTITTGKAVITCSPAGELS